MRPRLRVVLLSLVVIALVSVAALGWAITTRGFSARDEPSSVEAAIATRLRRLSIPREARTAVNPVPNSPEVLHEAMVHFADHCAMCHANDGSGATDLGLGLYPPPPDMREAGTQQLSDGELFYVIHNGIRFTGMPAFGPSDPAQDLDSWKLVHFIRHLPRISEEELAEMKEMNPRSPMQIRMEEEMKRFLEGEAPAPDPHAGHR
jgi:mono/diheme cytochrome c family protein